MSQREDLMNKVLRFIVLLLVAGVAYAQQDAAPDVQVRNTTQEVLGIIKSGGGDKKKISDLVQAKVLPQFNFVRMTQLAVGRPWRDANPQPQEQLADAFRTLLVRPYSRALELYKNHTV